MNCLSPLCLVLPGFCLVSSFGTYSSVSLFCLVFCVYVLGRSVTLPNLGKVALCRKCPMRPSSIPPLWSPDLYAQGVPPMCTFSCGRAGYCRCTSGRGRSLTWLTAACWWVGPGPGAGASPLLGWGGWAGPSVAVSLVQGGLELSLASWMGGKLLAVID